MRLTFALFALFALFPALLFAEAPTLDPIEAVLHPEPRLPPPPLLPMPGSGVPSGEHGGGGGGKPVSPCRSG